LIAPSVISISWGSSEVSTDQQGLHAYHDLFAAAASLCITVCAASGDHGTANLDAGDWDGKIHVNHPASDDLVLGCGGTQIVSGEDVVWNDGTPFDVNVQGGGGWASGGGVRHTDGCGFNCLAGRYASKIAAGSSE
jgi:kumamolisin